MSLNNACEIIFQAHKKGNVVWTKEAFKELDNHIKVLAQQSLLDDRVIIERPIRSLSKNTIINPKVLDCKSYIEAIELLNKQKAPTPHSTNIVGNEGSIFVHSPVSESIIETTVAPKVNPKKKMNINKIIILVSAIVTIILFLYFIYDRYFK